MSSKSKRQRSAVYSSDQTDQAQQSNETTTIVLEELRKNLPPDKKLVEGRNYVIRKTKRKGDYWVHFIDYFDENDTLRCECKYCEKTFACDSNVNGSKNVKLHVDKCLQNPLNKEKGKRKQLELFFQQGDKMVEDCEGKLKYGSGTVNLKDVREALVRCIIVDELPFRQVEKSGFKDLIL